MPSLKQQNSPTDPAEDMSGHSNFTTGLMGCCDSIAVFWNLHNNRYGGARGFHGGGGIPTVNFNSLMNAVPDGNFGQLPTYPLIQVCMGPDSKSPYMHNSIKSHVRSELARLGYQHVVLKFHWGADTSNWLLKDDGTCQKAA